MFDLKDFIEYVLLGLVQGITEPLPISSSGHMIIFSEIVGYTFNDLNFKIVTNFGSLLAIMLFYRLWIKDLAVGSYDYVFKKNQEEKSKFIYVLLILVATIPAAIAGVLLGDLIDETLSNILVVGVCLLMTGSLLMFIHFQSKKSTKETISLKDSIMMGFAQVFGMLPGISRSGITTAIGITNKVTLDKALRFSFMMYIPASLGALVYMFRDLILNGSGSEVFVLGYIGAFVVSFLGTYFGIRFFFHLVRKENLRYFGYYCLSMGSLLLILLAFGVLSI